MRHPIRYSSLPMRCVALLFGFGGTLVVGTDVVLPASQGKPDAAIQVQGVPEKPVVKVDLNTAGVEEIARLPGMNVQIAEKITEKRPYRKLDELITKKVLGKKEFAQVREYIVIGSQKK
jgi:DNA uptake protein ComE-like DNA-binding protein